MEVEIIGYNKRITDGSCLGCDKSEKCIKVLMKAFWKAAEPRLPTLWRLCTV